MSDRVLLLVAALTSLTWGLTGIFIRLLPPVSPMLVASARLFIALLIVLPIILLLKNRQHGLAIVPIYLHPCWWLIIYWRLWLFN